MLPPVVYYVYKLKIINKNLAVTKRLLFSARNRSGTQRMQWAHCKFKVNLSLSRPGATECYVYDRGGLSRTCADSECKIYTFFICNVNYRACASLVDHKARQALKHVAFIF